MNLQRGDLKNRVLNALWDLQQAEEITLVSVNEIREQIQSGKQQWAYTTVKTIADRLVEKGLVMRKKDALKYRYYPLVSRHELAIKAINRVMRHYFKNDVNTLLACLHHYQTSSEQSANERTKAHAAL